MDRFSINLAVNKEEWIAWKKFVKLLKRPFLFCWLYFEENRRKIIPIFLSQTQARNSVKMTVQLTKVQENGMKKLFWNWVFTPFFAFFSKHFWFKFRVPPGPEWAFVNILILYNYRIMIYSCLQSSKIYGFFIYQTTNLSLCIYI